MDQIHKAVIDLYGDWETLSEASQAFIENVMGDGRFVELYEETARGERETKDLLIQFEKDYPGVARESNVDEIAGNLQKKADQASVLASLRKKKAELAQTKSTHNENDQKDLV